MTLFEFNCPVKPISLNHAVKHGRRGSYRTTEFIKFRQMMFSSLREHGKKIIPDEPLRLYLVFHIPRNVFYTKAGVIAKRRNDLSNFIKHTEDCLAEHLGFNDSMIVEITTKKIPGDGWRIVGYIGLYEDN